MTKLIVIKEKTDELLKELRIGDETYNSVIWRNLEENPQWISKIIKLNKKEKVKTPSPKSTNEQTNKGL